MEQMGFGSKPVEHGEKRDGDYWKMIFLTDVTQENVPNMM